MILIDTNLVIDATDPSEPFHLWSVGQIAQAVAGEGGAVNAVIVAEIAVGAEDPQAVPDELRQWGLQVFDLPSAASVACGAAYAGYLKNRRAAGTPMPTSRTPLPDFFIGAHAQAMGWKIATRDLARFRTYFPGVPLVTP